MCHPGISKRGMEHILEMYALEVGLKEVQKMGGMKHQRHKRQTKE